VKNVGSLSPKCIPFLFWKILVIENLGIALSGGLLRFAVYWARAIHGSDKLENDENESKNQDNEPSNEEED